MKFLDRVFGERTARARGLAERARSLLDKGQNERAQEALVKALRLDPDSPEARELYAGLLCRRGLLRWTDGDLAGAVAEFTRSLKVVQNPIVMFHRGLVHKEAREYLKAIEDLSKVVRTEDPRSIPYLVWALAARGECYQEMGEVKGALKDFQVCIEQRAGGPSAYRYLFKCAGIEKQLGNAARAAELCARALEMRPGFKPAEVLRAALGAGARPKEEEKTNHGGTEARRSEGENGTGRKEEAGAKAVAETVVVAPTPVSTYAAPVATMPVSVPKPVPVPVAVVAAAPARTQKRAATRVADGAASEQVSFWERNTIPRREQSEREWRGVGAETQPLPVAVSEPVESSVEVVVAKETPVEASSVSAVVAEAPVVATGIVHETSVSLETATAPEEALVAPREVAAPTTREGRLLARVEALLKSFDGDGGPALDDSIDFLILAEQLRTRAVRTNGHAEAVRRAEARAREVVAANALVPFVRELSDEAGTLLARTNDEILHDRVTRHRARVLVRRFEKLTRAERFLFFESCGTERFSRFSALVDLAESGRLA